MARAGSCNFIDDGLRQIGVISQPLQKEDDVEPGVGNAHKRREEDAVSSAVDPDQDFPVVFVGLAKTRNQAFFLWGGVVWILSSRIGIFQFVLVRG